MRPIRVLAASATGVLLLMGHASATPSFFDNFDNSFPGEPGMVSDSPYSPDLTKVWPYWRKDWDHLNFHAQTDTASGPAFNHTPSTAANPHAGSARMDPEDPATLGDYHDFGATTGAVYATAWVRDYNSITGTTGSITYDNTLNRDTAGPINFYVGLYSNVPATASESTIYNDFALLGVNSASSGVSAAFPATNSWGYNSKTGGIADTGISRNTANASSPDGSGWVKVDIQADALPTDPVNPGDGQIRFYVDNTLAGTSQRAAGVPLQYIFIGSQSKNYEWIFYDDISVVPEPAAASVLGLCALAALRRRRPRLGLPLP